MSACLATHRQRIATENQGNARGFGLQIGSKMKSPRVFAVGIGGQRTTFDSKVNGTWRIRTFVDESA